MTQKNRPTHGRSAAPSAGLAARTRAFRTLERVLIERRPLEGDDPATRDAQGQKQRQRQRQRQDQDLAGRDRAFSRLLTGTVLRRLGELSHAVKHCLAERPPGLQGQRLVLLLQLGLAQILFLGTPAHAAVNSMVNLAGAVGLVRYKGLVNAVLRRAATGDGAFRRNEAEAARLNCPDWLWRRWHESYGAETAHAIAAAHLAIPPLDLTVPGDESAWTLWAERLGATIMDRGRSDATLRLAGAGVVRDLPGYGDGAWWVQDMAAAMPVRLAGPLAGLRIIDLCAAPGGKTAQLAAAGARVTALDRSAPRLARLRENLARLRLDAETVTADAHDWRPDHPADGLLLDAPCSATGTLRRHPDIAHLKGARDMAPMVALQHSLLCAAGSMVRPGGWIIYAVCSLEREEGEDVIARFLGGKGSSFTLAPEDTRRTLPAMQAEQGGMDGFFMARLIRKF